MLKKVLVADVVLNEEQRAVFEKAYEILDNLMDECFNEFKGRYSFENPGGDEWYQDNELGVTCNILHGMANNNFRVVEIC